jgi:spore maturation protein A
MNLIWSLMVIASLVTAALTGRMDETMNAVFEGASSAVSTLISFAGAMCFWTGIMKVAEKSGVSAVIRKIISPLVNRLFPSCSDKAKHYISMNMTANFLGMGNAATPMGMMAAQELDSENDNPLVPSAAMCMLVVINTTSFQLMPSTIIALRAAAGSLAPASVIVPIWLASAFALTVGVFAVKIMFLHRSVREGKSR